MLSSTVPAPWQVGPTSAPARVAAAALAALSFDSLFAWSAAPHAVEGIALAIIPLLVAIRAIRGFPGSLAASALTFAGAQMIALIALVQGGQPRPVQLSAVVVVALALSATGLGMIVLDRLLSRQSRGPVIAIPTSERSPVTAVGARSR